MVSEHPYCPKVVNVKALRPSTAPQELRSFGMRVSHSKSTETGCMSIAIPYMIKR